MFGVTDAELLDFCRRRSRARDRASASDASPSSSSSSAASASSLMGRQRDLIPCLGRGSEWLLDTWTEGFPTPHSLVAPSPGFVLRRWNGAHRIVRVDVDVDVLVRTPCPRELRISDGCQSCAGRERVAEGSLGA